MFAFCVSLIFRFFLLHMFEFCVPPRFGPSVPPSFSFYLASISPGWMIHAPLNSRNERVLNVHVTHNSSTINVATIASKQKSVV
uniref:Putative secreted protein n=1 Tax=Anopheles marajoara TaxID=58244 RepID=A0A2M4CAX9_9DIPT